MASEKSTESKWDPAIAELRKRKPFDPFRLVARDGRKHLIADPAAFIVRDSDYWFPDRRSDVMVKLLKADVVGIEELRPMSLKR